MAKKSLLAFLGAALLLVSCSGETGSSSSNPVAPSSGETPSSSAEAPSSSDPASSDPASSDPTSSTSSLSVDTTPFVPGDSTNDEEYDYDNIIVNTPTNKLAEDFAYGVDLSTVKEIETLGGKYYDKDGKEADVFKILADGGANYCRLRLWVDPYDADGNPYGGGTNDLATDIYLALRAQNAGMKVCVNFHLSDSWTDPGKQYRPKAWGDQYLLASDVPAKAGSYIQESLQAFKDYGVNVASFQVGNETNSGICGFGINTSSSNLTMPFNVYKYGIEGGKAVFPEADAIIHLTNIRSNSAVKQYLDKLEEYEVPYDIAGFSYYPYWHGTQSNLLDILTYAANKGKDTMVMETSWGFTDEQNEVVSNQYSSTGFGNAGGYETSTQAQATELADIIDILSQVPNQRGKGIFYWEPAWLPTPGTGWCTKAGAFYNDYGRDPASDAEIAVRDAYTDAYCKASWSNQAVFSYTGKVLPSAYTYKFVQDGTKAAEEEIVSLVSDKLTHTINLKDDSTLALPTTVKMKTNTDAHRNVSVTWDQTAYDAMIAAGDGEYTINGTTSNGNSVTCEVIIETNFVADPSFENQGSAQENEVKEPWVVTGDGRIERKGEGNRTGTAYYHWYNAGVFTWDLSQTIEMDQAGTFRLRTYMMSNTASGYESMDMYYKINDGEEVVMDALWACQGWVADLTTGMILVEMKGIELAVGDTIVIGMRSSCLAGSWGHMDDWSLVKYNPEDEPVYGLQDGSFETQTALDAETTPWSLETTGSPDRIGILTDHEPVDGTKCLDWWSSTAFTFTLKQTFTVEKAGTYILSTNLNAEAYTADAGFNSASISYKVGNAEAVSVDLSEFLTGWADGGLTWSQEGIVVGADETVVTISLTMDCKAGNWGHNDLWSFGTEGGSEPVTPTVPDKGIPDGSFETTGELTTSSTPWSMTEGSSGVSIGSGTSNINVGDGGSHYLTWWAEAAFSFTVQNTFTVETAGTYTLSTYFNSIAYADGYNSAVISYQLGDAEAVEIALDATVLAGWSDPTAAKLFSQEGIEVAANTEVTIKLVMDCKAGSWGHNDGWSFVAA